MEASVGTDGADLVAGVGAADEERVRPDAQFVEQPVFDEQSGHRSACGAWSFLSAMMTTLERTTGDTRGRARRWSLAFHDIRV